MSSARENASSDPGGAKIIEEHQIVGPDGEEEIEAVDDQGRRWYHLRPEPRRRTDFMGFNTTWWVVLWIIAVVLLIFPFSFWW